MGPQQNTDIVVIAPDFHFLKVLPSELDRTFGEGSRAVIATEMQPIDQIMDNISRAGLNVELLTSGPGQRLMPDTDIPIESAYLGRAVIFNLIQVSRPKED